MICDDVKHAIIVGRHKLVAGQDLFYTTKGVNYSCHRKALWSGPGVFFDEVRIFGHVFLHVHWIKEGEMGVCRSNTIMVRQRSEEQLSEHSAIGTVLRIILAIFVPP